jgi:hypothetical protein
MNLEVERRHTNLQWQADVAESFPEEVSRERVRLQALQLVRLNNLTTEVREMSVALSGLALAQARAELVPQLMAQHRLAAPLTPPRPRAAGPGLPRASVDSKRLDLHEGGAPWGRSTHWAPGLPAGTADC